jgi:hypothetical protein
MAIPVLQTTVSGALSAPGAVTASETINGNLVASNAILQVVNGSGVSINVTFTDPGRTPLGNTGTQAAVAVAAGATRFFKLTTGLVDGASGNITVGFSATTTITAQILY